jgi:hypothetical protein
MKHTLWICVALLLILHQDYWQWDNATLDFGFLPRTMTYHIGLSIIVAIFWWSATYLCWPADLASDLAENDDPASEESES